MQECYVRTTHTSWRGEGRGQQNNACKQRLSVFFPVSLEAAVLVNRVASFLLASG